MSIESNFKKDGVINLLNDVNDSIMGYYFALEILKNNNKMTKKVKIEIEEIMLQMKILWRKWEELTKKIKNNEHEINFEISFGLLVTLFKKY